MIDNFMEKTSFGYQGKFDAEITESLFVDFKGTVCFRNQGYVFFR